MFYDNKIINANELSFYLKKDSYDCAIFDHDDYDQHVLILNQHGRIELNQALLFTENMTIMEFLKSLNLTHNDNYYEIPFELLSLVDEFLKTL